jgi:hypothetical protein
MKTKQLLFLMVCTLAFANTYAANRYWVASANATWAATTSWSETAGGAPGASAPTTGDDVFFETGAATTVTLGDAVTVNSITFTSRNVTFAGAFGLVTNSMTTTSSQVIFVDNVTVNSALAFSGTNPRISQKGLWGKTFTLGNGGAFTLTGHSATNYFGGTTTAANSSYTFNTTSALTVFFDQSTTTPLTLGGITVTKGLITLGNNVKLIRIVLTATNSQELILAPDVTLTYAGGGTGAFTGLANGGVVNASASGSKVIISTANAVPLNGVGRFFKTGTIINHFEFSSIDKTFNLFEPIKVRTLTLTAGTINNSTNSITIEDGGSVVTVAGSLTAPVLLSAIHSVSKTSEPVFHYNNGIVTLKYTSDSMDKVHFKLMNLNGQLILSKSIQSTTGTNTVSISIGELPSGIYLTSISDGVNSLTDKIILK